MTEREEEEADEEAPEDNSEVEVDELVVVVEVERDRVVDDRRETVGRRETVDLRRWSPPRFVRKRQRQEESGSGRLADEPKRGGGGVRRALPPVSF